MACYAFHQTTLCGRDIEPPQIMPVIDDAAAYSVAQTLLRSGNRVIEVWRGQTLVWRFETAGQQCDATCEQTPARLCGGFERWIPACRLHPLNIALASAQDTQAEIAA